MITDGFNGYLFLPQSIDDLKEKILKFLDNTNLATGLGKNARQFAEQSFTGENHLQKLLELYNSVHNESFPSELK